MEQEKRKKWHWSSIMLVILLPILAIAIAMDSYGLFDSAEEDKALAAEEKTEVSKSNIEGSHLEDVAEEDAVAYEQEDDAAEQESDSRAESKAQTADATKKTDRTAADIPDFAVAARTLEGHDTEEDNSRLAKPEDKVYDVVEQMPSFPGGPAALMQYLNNSIRYPEEAKANGIRGRVTVQFVVEKDGSISGVSTMRSADPLLDREAMRIVSNMPKWKPGKGNGSPVRVKYFVPVVFR